MKIVVLGSTNTDMVITGKKIPVPGETVSGGTFLMNPGGKGANQAVAVARLSAKKGTCVFIAKVGDDLFGRESAARLRKDTIDAKLVVDRKNASGTALILVDSKGQNVISVALGANATLSPADIRPFLKDIATASALLMQLETPLDTVTRAAEVARAAGVPVILNPAPARKLPAVLFNLVDWLTPNETEAEILTGVKVTDAKSAAKAVAALKKKGVASADFILLRQENNNSRLEIVILRDIVVKAEALRAAPAEAGCKMGEQRRKLVFKHRSSVSLEVYA